MLLTGFEPEASGVGIDSNVQCAKTTALMACYFVQGL